MNQACRDCNHLVVDIFRGENVYRCSLGHWDYPADTTGKRMVHQYHRERTVRQNAFVVGVIGAACKDFKAREA